MPEEKTLQRAHEDAREGKSPSTQAGEFVREEIEHVREGKHGVRNTKQAIAIGLSKARRAGIKLPPPKEGAVSEKTRRQAARDRAKGQSSSKAVSPTRSKAVHGALEREGSASVSASALSRQASSAAQTRSAADRSRAAQKAVRTKGEAGRKKAASKAARTRAGAPNV
jgi:hypothetical protein